ncbi:uncharacterized protein [Odocoileus virginianus]|uniref:Uncharacterized protein n=1 Tax=Odocoileus virginianus TaxID=9874 RepID=A0ABM4HS11_ODOVR
MRGRNSRPRAAWPRRVPGARRRPREPLPRQDSASPCLPRPGVPPPVRLPLRSEGRPASRARRSRGSVLRRGSGPQSSAPPRSPRSLRLALR